MKISQGWFFSVALFVAAYTEIGLTIGGVFIPSFFSILIVFCVLFVVKNYVRPRDVLYFFCAVLFFFISAVLAPNYDDFGSRLTGVVQFSVAIFTFFVSFRFFLAFGKDKSVFVFFWLIRFLVVLTFLEYVGLLTDFSDSFRSLVYTGSNYTIYDADLRDISLGNSIRPKVFTSEPSLVAIGFFVLMVSLLSNVTSKVAIAELFLLAIFQYYILNSPIVLLGILVSVFVLCNRAFGFVSVIAVAAVLFSALFLFSDFLGDRLSRLSLDYVANNHVSYDVENEKSERLRLYYPYRALVDVFEVNPYTGLGVSGKRSLEKYSTVTPIYQIAFGNNAFATIFIYFGIVGGLFFIYFLWRYVSLYVKTPILFFLVVFSYMQTLGGFETVRMWMYISFIVAFLSFDNSSTRTERI